ncbi:MAG: PadR family transcriptional regulator [Chloroflexi bacterium]|nr:PadR family transcriptional regulator [Chloroflexota bacterium]
MSPKRKSNLSIEHALLGFIQEQPLHGYEIHQRLQAAQQLGLVWHLKQAHLYALLSKLESDGLIAAELIAQEARPPRRLLQLTAAGREAFANWVAAPVQHGRDLRIEFLAKLFWAQQRGATPTEQLIAAQRDECRMWLDNLRVEMAQSTDTTPYALLVLEFRRGQIEAMLEWLDTCESALASAAT